MISCLVPCPGCARHVRQSEEECPFCGGPVPVAIASVEASATLSGGRSRTRAAILLAGAATLAACGKEPTTVDPTPPKPTDNRQMTAPAYGAPPPFMLPDGATSTTPPEPAPSTPAKDAGAKN
jgi:hypothetical protein